LSYGFKNYAWKTFVKENKPIVSVPVSGADIDKVPVGTVYLLGIPAKIGDNSDGRITVIGIDGKPLRKLVSPVTRGQAVGIVQLIVNNKIVSAVPAVALAEALPSKKLKILKTLKQVFMIVVAVLIGGFIIGKIAKISRRYRRRLKAKFRKVNPDGPGES
jgi:hypothetical protein